MRAVLLLLVATLPAAGWDVLPKAAPPAPAAAPARHAPCEVRPPAEARPPASPPAPAPRPAAEIEESSDRDPVQPVPRPKPRKGQPDGRAVAEAPPPAALRVSGTRDEVFARFIARARAEGQPHGFRWTGSDGEVASLVANPDGTVEVVRTNRSVVATSPPAPNVIPPQGPPSAPVYYPPAAYYQPMPAGGPAASTFPGRGTRGRFPEDHSCPACRHVSALGTGNWVVRGFTATGHLHRCERCGYEGEH